MKATFLRELIVASVFLLVATIASRGQTNYTPYTFTTLAGGSSGYNNGTGTNAQFENPDAIAVDGAGNVFVGQSYQLRVISPAGVVQTLVGTPNVEACGNGTNSFAYVGQPSGMVASTTGAASTVIFPDLDCSTIRQASGTGTNWQIAVIAGTYPNTGYRDGMDGAAEFSGFGQMAQDSAGNLYVADTQNEAIRKITPVGADWDVSTLAGNPTNGFTVDGTNGDAHFTAPVGVAVDNNSGNVYVLQNNYCIRQIVQQGTNVIVTTIVGQPGVHGYVDAIGTNALFSTASQIAADSSGNLYIADRGNYVIRRLQLTGTNWVMTTLAGLGAHEGYADGTGSAVRFGIPFGIAVDNAGAVYVSDLYSQAILKGVPATPLQILGPTVHFSGGQLSFNIAGPYKETVVVSASNDLQYWSPVWTNVFGLSPLIFTDSQSGNYTNRFYRAALPPQ